MIGLGLGLVLVGTVGCRSTPETKPAEAEAKAAPSAQVGAAKSAEPLPDRDPALARRLVREEGALLLDVRSQAEFDEGHVDGAVLIPHDELAERIAEVAAAQGNDKSKPIVVYCRSGGRAGKAKQTLKDAGYETVTNLGGFTDWCDDC